MLSYDNGLDKANMQSGIIGQLLGELSIGDCGFRIADLKNQKEPLAKSQIRGLFKFLIVILHVFHFLFFPSAHP